MPRAMGSRRNASGSLSYERMISRYSSIRVVPLRRTPAARGEALGGTLGRCPFLHRCAQAATPVRKTPELRTYRETRNQARPSPAYTPSGVRRAAPACQRQPSWWATYRAQSNSRCGKVRVGVQADVLVHEVAPDALDEDLVDPTASPLSRGSEARATAAHASMRRVRHAPTGRRGVVRGSQARRPS